MAGLLVGDVSGHMASFSQPKRPSSCSIDVPACLQSAALEEWKLYRVEQDGDLMRRLSNWATADELTIHSSSPCTRALHWNIYAAS